MLFCLILTMKQFDEMKTYKRFRNMNAYYYKPDDKTIFFKSYDTDIFYFTNDLYPFFSFKEWTGRTTQKQISVFLDSEIFLKVSNHRNIKPFYKTVLNWVRKKGYRWVDVSVSLYYNYMLIHVGVNFFRVSYNGETLKKYI